MFGSGFILDTVILYLILIAMIISSLLLLVIQSKIDVMLAIFFMILVYAFTLFFKLENLKLVFTTWDDLMNNPIYFNILAIVGYVLTRHISDYDLFLNFLTKFSIINVILTILNYFLLIRQELAIDYMTISYDALLFVTFLLLMYFEKKKKLLGLIGFLGALFILIAGARGAFISLILTIIFYFAFSFYPLYKKVLLILFLFITGLFLSKYYETVAFYILDNLLPTVIKSRTINAFLEGAFLEDSGRGDIQKELMNNLSISGSGIFADRYTGFYAHNFIVEILYQWGLIVGPFLLILFFLLLFWNIYKRKGKSFILFTVFLSAGFFKLFFSGSYLVEINFAVLLAISMSSLPRFRYLNSA